MSEAADRRGWGTWFAPTGTPPAWGLVRYMTAGLLLGILLSAALPEIRGALLGGLTGLVVAAAGSGGPSGVARRVALASAAASLVLTVIAFATGTRPVWAALAMAAVALVTSLAAAAGPLGAVLGFLGSLAYFPGGGLTTIGSILLAGAPTGDIPGWAARRILDVLAGCAIALAATYVLWPHDEESDAPVPAPT